jgi:hypothetical protein
MEASAFGASCAIVESVAADTVWHGSASIMA